VTPITGYRGFFPGVKRPGPEVDYSTPPCAGVRMSSAILHPPHYILLWHRHGQFCLFTERTRMLGIFMSSQFINP